MGTPYLSLPSGRSKVSVFSVFTNGDFQLNYGWLSQQVDETLMAEFHGRIQAIPRFANVPAEFTNKWPKFRIAEAFKDPQDLQTFEEAVLWLGKQAIVSN